MVKEYIPLEILAKIFLNFKDKKIAITMVSGLASFFPKVTDLRVSCLLWASEIILLHSHIVTVPLVHSNITRHGINHHYTVQFGELLLK